MAVGSHVSFAAVDEILKSL